jgi:hypothetical protein
VEEVVEHHQMDEMVVQVVEVEVLSANVLVVQETLQAQLQVKEIMVAT